MVSEKKYNLIKLRISEFLLKRKLNTLSRKTKVCSIDKAKTVGVSFVVRSMNDIDGIRILLKKLSKHGLQTFVLGYIPQKNMNDFYLSQKAFNFFSDKDLDFLLRPKGESALEFMNSKFDILIDLNSSGYYPMDFILNMSKAFFKVGRFGSDKPFDLMMNIDLDKSDEFYFDQVIHYLTMLN